MPYRRLPNTDQARLRALRAAIQKTYNQNFANQVVTFNTLYDAKTYLGVFEKLLIQYKQTLDNQVTANKRYQQIVYNSRLYLSHFIQVLNLAVIRGDIKKEYKTFFNLDTESHTVPDLSTEAALLEWGKSIINGENERVRNGGFPIYNPAIAKVQVHFEVFKEYKSTQKLHQHTTNRSWEDLVAMRERGDAIILDIWNQVESSFKDEKPFSKLNKCKSYGLIYYYRKGEAELTIENDV